MPRTYFNKFNRGEIDEDVTARDDVERIHNSSALMENFLPKRVGTMQYRPGTAYLGDVKPNGSHYMIPFVDDGDNPTVLELSQSTANPSVESVRFWVNDSLTTATGTTDTITNGSFATDITGWTADHTGTGSAVWETNGRLQLNGGSAGWGRVYQTVTRTAGKRTILIVVDESPVLVQIGTSGSQSNDIFEDYLGFGRHVLTFEPDADYTITLANDAAYNAYVAESDHVAAGTLEISGPIVPDLSTNAITLTTLRYAQVRDVVFITDNGYELSGRSWPFWTLKRRGLESWSFELPNQQDGPFGFLNDTATTLAVAATTGNTTLTASVDFFNTDTPNTSVRDQYKIESGADYGICEVVSVVSATVANVRILKEMPNTTATIDWRKGEFQVYGPGPTAVELFEGRLWLSGAGRVWASVSDEFTSFDEERTGDSAAISKTLGFGPVQDVAWMKGAEVLLLGLSSEEVEINSNADYDVISASNIRARRGTNKGAAKVRPEVVDKVIYMVQRGLLKLFALSGLSGENIEAFDTTLLHPQVLSPGVKRIVYSSEPEPRMYVLLTNGELRVLLFDNVEDVNAWSRISLGGGGSFVDIVASPTTAEDAVYVIIERDGTRYMERFATVESARGQTDSRHYDSHVVYTSPGATASGLNHLEGETVYIWADGIEKGKDVVSSGAITLDESTWTDVVVGLRHTAKWKSNRLARYVEDTVINYRKRIVQVGFAARNVALRNIKFGPEEQRLTPVPEVDQGRPRAPTNEPEPTITDTIDGSLTVTAMEIYQNYLVCACDSVPPSLLAIRDQYSVYYDGAVYWAGGVQANNQTWKYVIATGEVVALADMPEGGQAQGSITIDKTNGVIYCMVIDSLGGAVNTFAKYVISTDTWSLPTQPPTAILDGPGLAYYNGFVYRYGGGVAGSATTTFEKYNIGLDSWSTETPLSGSPVALYNHKMVIPQAGTGAGKIYLHGGGANSFVGSGNMYEYNISTQAWSTLTGTGSSSKHYTGKMEADDNGSLYIWGGQSNAGFRQNNMEKYSITGDSWSEVNDGTGTAPVSRDQFGFAIDVPNDKIYMSLGSGVVVYQDMWEYDLGTDAWTELSDELTVSGGALRFIDISDPDLLANAGNLDLIATGTSGDQLLGYGTELVTSAVGEVTAYVVTREDDVASQNRGVAAVDVLNPLAPVQTDYLEGAAVGAVGIAAGVLADFPYLYVPSHSTNGTLSVLDITDRTNLSEVGTVALTFASNAPNPYKMAKLGNYVYIAWEDDLHVIDVSSPTSPVDNIVSISPIAFAAACSLDGFYLLILDPTAGKLAAYDVSIDPLNPSLLATLTDSRLIGVNDLVSFFPWVYLVGGTSGHVVDFRVASSPAYFAQYTGFADLTSIQSKDPNILFVGANTSPAGKVYAADQRDWTLVDYDEMSFPFDGKYDTDSRFCVQSTGPCVMQAMTIEVEDIDDPTNGSDRPLQS